MSTEFTLEQFRAACVITPDSNCRGFLSGSRAIEGHRITWHSAHGEHYMQCDVEADADPIAALFSELQKMCIIRDCLIPETPLMHVARLAEERRARIVAHAKEAYRDEGNLEFDDNAEVSENDNPQENGAYVQCWKWVPFAGTEFDKENAD